MGLIAFIGGAAALAVRVYNRLRKSDPQRLDTTVRGFRQAARVTSAFTAVVETVLNALALIAPAPQRPALPGGFAPRRSEEPAADFATG